MRSAYTSAFEFAEIDAYIFGVEFFYYFLGSRLSLLNERIDRLRYYIRLIVESVSEDMDLLIGIGGKFYASYER